MDSVVKRLQLSTWFRLFQIVFKVHADAATISSMFQRVARKNYSGLVGGRQEVFRN